jgi:hypothetical protein
MLLIKQWDGISVLLSSSLDHYTTYEVHSPRFLFWKPGKELSISGV